MAVLIVWSTSLVLGCNAFDNNALEQLKDELRDAGNSPPPPMDGGMDGGRIEDSGPIDSGRDDEDTGADDEDGGTLPPARPCDRGHCFWSGATADGCATVGRPTAEHRPASDSSRELPPFYIGISRMRLGNFLPDGTQNDDAWTTFGLDLDGTCTNSSTCDAPRGQVSCRSPAMEVPFDGLECRDNTFARLQPVAAMVPEIGEMFGLGEDVFNCALWHGDYTVITKISGYNGEPNDDQVRLDFYTSTGLETPPAFWSCPAENFDQSYPLWRSSLRWRINEADLAEPMETPGQLPASVTAVSDAYVRDGYIVATLPSNMVFRMAGDRTQFPGFRLVVQNGVWTGRLEQGLDDIWRVRDGLLAGAVTKEDLLRAFREIGLCPVGTVSLYSGVETYVNENADVRADGMSDPELDCDALSLGIMIEADGVTPGMLTTISTPIECAGMNPDTDGGL